MYKKLIFMNIIYHIAAINRTNVQIFYKWSQQKIAILSTEYLS